MSVPSVFINYRRSDGSAHARSITERLGNILKPTFGEFLLFTDVDSLKPGEDWTLALPRAIDSCQLMLAIITRDWLDARDDNNVRRIERPDDVVSMEIRHALKSGIPIIPILIEDLRMPNSTDLPPDLQGLIRRQAISVKHFTFRSDIEILADQVGRAILPAPLQVRMIGDWKIGQSSEWLVAVYLDVDPSGRCVGRSEWKCTWKHNNNNSDRRGWRVDGDITGAFDRKENKFILHQVDEDWGPWSFDINIDPDGFNVVLRESEVGNEGGKGYVVMKAI